MTNSFSSAVFSILFANVYTIFVGILFTPIIVRLLGPAQYGVYATLISIYTFVTVFVNAGTSDGVRKFISERSEATWEAAIFGYVFRFTVLLLVFTSLTVGVLAWTGAAASVLGEQFTELFYLVAVMLLVDQLSGQVRATLMGLKREFQSEVLGVVYKTLFFVLAVGFVYYGLGVPGILLGEIVSSLVVLVAGLAVLSRTVPLRSIVTFPNTDIPKRQIFVYIVSSVWFYLLLLSLYHVDILLLQLWSTDDAVGYYKGALSIAEALWLAPIAIQLALLQRVSRLWREGEVDAIERQARIVTRYAFSITALMVIGLAVLANDFVLLYLGEEFTPAVAPLLLLLPGVLGFALARPSLAINQARSSLRPLLVATGACSLINLVLNVLLIPTYGMIGAAVATSIGYGSLPMFQSMAARYLGYDPLAGIRWRATLFSAGITVAVILPVAVLLSSPLVALLVVPPLGAAVYGAATIATGAITPSDVELIVDALGFLPGDVRRTITWAANRIPRVYE